MVGIDILDVLGLFQYQESFQLALLLKLDNQVYQQHVGISSLLSIQLRTLIPYRDRNGE